MRLTNNNKKNNSKVVTMGSYVGRGRIVPCLCIKGEARERELFFSIIWSPLLRRHLSDHLLWSIFSAIITHFVDLDGVDLSSDLQG